MGTLHVFSPKKDKHAEYINNHEIITNGTKIITHVLNFIFLLFEINPQF